MHDPVCCWAQCLWLLALSLCSHRNAKWLLLALSCALWCVLHTKRKHDTRLLLFSAWFLPRRYLSILLILSFALCLSVFNFTCVSFSHLASLSPPLIPLVFSFPRSFLIPYLVFLVFFLSFPSSPLTPSFLLSSLIISRQWSCMRCHWCWIACFTCPCSTLSA